MTRGSFVVALVFAALLGWPVRAEADMWDWIQEFSGPGPFNSRGNILGTICLDRRWHFRTTATTSATGSLIKVPCLFVDVRRFENRDDDNFPSKVRITAYDFGPTWELWDQGEIEIGTGLGLMRFTSNNVTEERLTFTYMRLAIEPLSLIKSLAGKKGAGWTAALKWYVRETLVPGTLNATDFGVPLGTGPRQSTFTVENDRVTSMGFMVDVGEIARWLQNR